MDVYGKSDKIEETVNMLNTINDKTALHYTQQEAVFARNHLMIVICFGNATRASNLINITLDDVKNIERDLEYDAYSLSSSFYKTSSLYGEKKILLGEDLYKQVIAYMKYLRPKIIRDQEKKLSERYLFTSTRNNGRMNTCIIS